MTPAPPVQRETVGRTIVAVWAIRSVRAILAVAALSRLRLAAGYERRKPLHILIVRRRDVLLAWLAMLRLCLRLMLVLIARIEGLRLARRKRLADGGLIAVAIIVAVIGEVAALLAAALLIVGLALAELLLRRGNHAEVMLGMLIIILGRDRVAGTLRIAGKLEILFGDVRCRTPDFHVRPIGLVHARQWILVMATLAVATPHALVLTVSHGCFSANPFICGETRAAASLDPKSFTEFHYAVMSQQIQLSANTALSQSSHHRRARRNAANLRYALHSKMRAAPIKLLGLNLAIPFAVRSGFRSSGFRYT
jgi:hypothetical protein